jgi:hypothetical protein
MGGHQGQSDPFPDLNLRICHDLGAARRDVHYETIAHRQSAIDRDRGRLMVRLPPRFALNLRPGLIDNHHDHPSLKWLRAGQTDDRAGHQIKGDSLKVSLGLCLEIY